MAATTDPIDVERRRFGAATLAAALGFVSCGGGASLGPPPSAGAAGWLTRAPLPRAIQECGVAAIDDEIYVVGGFGATQAPLAQAYAYRPAVDGWRRLADAPRVFHHPNVAVVHGRLYVVGTLLDTAFTAGGNCWEYDPRVDRWTVRSPMPAGSQRGAAGAGAIDGRIHVAGGLRGGRSVADHAVYDLAADQWTILPPLPTARDHLVAAVVQRRLYVLAGRQNGMLLGEVEVFDPAAARWSPRTPVPTPRGGCMGGLLSGRIVVAGGEGNPAPGSDGVFGETEVYDPAADRWSAGPRMATPRHGTGAATIGELMFVPGGAPVQGYGAIPVHEALRL